MSLRKESDKDLSMNKKESSIQREANKRKSDNEVSDNKSSTNQKSKDGKSSIRQGIKGGLVKGGDSLRQNLESDDQGIESAGKLSEGAFKTTKATTKGVKKINKVRKNRKENKLVKADQKNLESVKDKLVDGNKVKAKKPRKKPRTSKNNKRGFLNKVINQPKKIAVLSKDKGIESFKENLESDDQGVEVGSKGTKLIKDGTKSIINANRNRRKKGVTKKLRGSKTKLRRDGRRVNSSARKGRKGLQKRRLMRRSIARSRPTSPSTLTAITNRVKLVLRSATNALRSAGIGLVNRMMGTKIVAWIGAITIKLIPVFVVLGLLFGIIFIAVSMGGAGAQENQVDNIMSLDPEVEQWRELVSTVAEEQDMSDYTELALSIIQVETGGTGTADIMQSSESAGHPSNYFETERESVEQGIKYLKSAVTLLGGYDVRYKKDYKLIAQMYNFGIGFGSYTSAQEKDGYNLELAEKYSKDVVAYSLGNTTGETYVYENPTSIRLEKPYLYKSGGNFLYGELISQYLVEFGDGEMAPPVEPMLVTSHFGSRSSPGGGIGSTNHKGIDLNCTGGFTPINSLLGGTVVKSKYVNGLGNTVIVKHENSLYSTYAHMSSLIAKQGQSVQAGETLGICGSTGNSTGPHLHLELSPQPHENQINPYPHIKHLIGG